MDVKCLVCGEVLVSLKAHCHGQFSHCGVTVRFVFSQGRLRISEHSEEAYSPLTIYADIKRSLPEKERDLRVLHGKLASMERDSMMFARLRKHTAEYLNLVRKSMGDSAVANSFAKPKDTFKDLKVKWNDKKGFSMMWRSVLSMYAKQKTDLTDKEIERIMSDVTSAVRFARKHGIEVPDQFRNVR